MHFLSSYQTKKIGNEGKLHEGQIRTRFLISADSTFILSFEQMVGKSRIQSRKWRENLGSPFPVRSENFVSVISEEVVRSK